MSTFIQKTDKQEPSLAPNKFLQPMAYQTWKIIGNTIAAQEDKYLGQKIRPFREFVYRFTKSFAGVFGSILFILLILSAIIIPFTTVDPHHIDPNNRFIAPFSHGTILGTDNLGRDVWANLWYGLRFSLLLALVVSLVDLIIGVSLGIIMGYNDKFDYVCQFIIKVLTNVPVLIIMILATLVFKPSFWVLAISMSITGWTNMASQIRAQVKRGRNFQWVVASKMLGTSTSKIMFNFVPLIIPMLITQLVFTIPGAILGETALAFIGLSLPNVPTLGNMIADGSSLVTAFPRYVLIPSIVLVVLVTSIQLIGNATQDALRRQR